MDTNSRQVYKVLEKPFVSMAFKESLCLVTGITLPQPEPPDRNVLAHLGYL